MSQEIDKRVVEMQFDNKQFEKNVQTSLNTIDKLKMALNFDGAKGLDSITQAAKKMDLSNISQQTQKVQLSFSALQIAGYTMVSELTKSFMNFGKNIWNMSIGQAKSGGMARALKIEQANFKMQALAKNLDAVKQGTITVTELMEKMADAIDRSVTGTAYGYDAAANVASQLMASGITNADKMYDYLRGIAGAAAMTGRSFEDIGNIFTTVASNGKLMTMQLRQFSASGLNVAATLAQTTKFAGQTEASIAEMVTKGKIGFEDFADAMNEAFGEAAGKADDTYAGVLSNVKAQLSRLGQRFAVPYINNMIPFLQKLKATIKTISATLQPIAERFDRIFGRLTKYGANILDSINYQKFTAVFRGIENILWGVAMVLHTVRDAFIEVFPPKTADMVVSAAQEFEKFTEQLLPTKEALDGLKGIFVALFAPLRLVVRAFSMLTKYTRPIVVALLRVVYAFTSVFSVLEPIVMQFLQFIDSLGLFETALNLVVNVVVYAITIFEVLIVVLVNLVKKIAESERLKNFAKTLQDIGYAITETVVKALIFLIELIDAVVARFNDAAKGNGNTFFDRLINNAVQLWEILKQLWSAFALWFDSVDSLKGLRSIVEFFGELGGLIKDFFTGGDITDNADAMANAIHKLSEAFHEMGAKFKAAWEDIDKGEVIMIAFAAVIIAVMLAIKNLIDVSAGFVEKMTDIPGILKDIRTAIQNIGNFSGPAQAILAFSAAVAVVTNSLIMLSKIQDQDKLRNAAIAIGSITGALLIFTIVMSTLSKKINKDEQIVDKAALNLIAITGSILALSLAIKMLAELNADAGRIFAAVGGIIALMGALIVSMRLLNKFVPELKGGTIAFITFSASMIILVKAIQMIDNIKLDHMIETMSAMATLMVGFGWAISMAGKASGWASLAIAAFTGSVVVLFGMFMLLAAIPMDIIADAISKATAVFMMFIPLILTIGIASSIAGNTGKAMFGGTLWALVIGLTAFLGMFIIFAKTTQGMDLGESLASVSILVLTITGFLGAILAIEGAIAKEAGKSRETLRNAKNSDKTFRALSGLLYGLTSVILAIGITAKLMQNVDEGKLWLLVDMVGIIGIALVAITGLTSKNSVPKQGAAGIMTIVGLISTMGLIIAALIALQFADEEKLVIAATAITICTLAVSMLMAAMSAMPAGNINRYAKTATMLIGLIVSIGAVFAAAVIALNQSKDIPTQTMWAFGLSMAALLGVIGLIVYGFSGIPSANYKNSAIGIAMMSAVLLACAGVIYILQTKVPDLGKGMIAKLVVMGVLFAALGAMLLVITNLNKYGGKEAISAATALAIVAGSLVLVAGSLAGLGLVFKDVPIETTIAIMAGLAILFGEMIGMMAILDKLTRYSSFKAGPLVASASAIAVLAGAFIEIAAAFAIMKSSGASPDDIWSYTGAFAALFAVLGVSAVGLGALLTYIPGLIYGVGAVAVVFLAFGSACKSIGEGFYYVAEAVKMLGSTTEEEVDRAIDAFLHFMDRIPEVTKAIKDRLPEIIDTISIVMRSIGELVGTFIGDIVAMGVIVFARALAENIDVLLKSVALVLGVIVDWLNDSSTQKLIYDTFFAFGRTILNALAGLIEGLTGIKIQIEGIIDTANGEDDTIAGLREMVTDYFNLDTHDFYKWKDTYETVMTEMAKYAKIPFNEMSEEQQAAYKDMTAWMDKLMQEAAEHEWYLTLDERLFSIDKSSDITKSYMRMFSEIYKYLGEDQEAFDRLLTGLYAYGDEINRIQKNNGNYTSYIEDIYGASDFWENQFSHVKEFEGKAENARNVIEEAFANTKLSDSTADLEYDLDYLSTYTKMISQNYEDLDAYMALISGQKYDPQWNKLTEELETRLNKDIADTKYSLEDAMKVLDRFGLSGAYTADDLSIHFKRASEDAQSIGYSYSDAAEKIEEVNPWDDVKEALGGTRREFEETFENAAGGYDKLQYTMAKSPIRPRIDSMALEGFNTQLGVINKGLTKLGGKAVQLKDDIAPVVDNVEDQGEASTDTATATDNLSTSANGAANNINNLSNSLKDAIKNSNVASNVFGGLQEVLNGFGNVSLLNGVDSWLDQKNLTAITRTAEEWAEYGSELVDAPWAPAGTYQVQRWQTYMNGTKRMYSSLEDYVNKNSNYGESIFTSIFGGYDADKAAEEATEKAKDFANELFGGKNGLDAFGDAASDAADETDKLGESIKSTLDVFTQFNDEAKTSSRAIFKSFESQIDGIKKWQGELEELATRGMNQNFLKELADEGPSAYDKIHAFYTMSSNELALFNRMYAEKLVLQDDTANHIRQSFVDAGIMFQDEADAMARSIGDRYDAAVLKAQAEAASKKNGQMTAATKKRLAQMYAEIEKYQADTEFIEKWYDSNAVIGETAGEAIATNAEETLNKTVIGTAAYKEAGKEMVELIGDGITSASPDIIKGMEDLGKASMESLKASLEFEKVLEPINKFRSSVYDQVEGSLKLFDEVKQKTAKEEKESQISATQMLYNMAENTKKIGRWATNLKTLAAKGMSEGLLEELRKLGPEGADKVDAFVRMTSDQLKKANSFYNSSTNLAGYVSDKLTSTYAEQGFAMSLGLKKGINEGKGDILAQMYEIGTESSEGFKNGIDPDAAKQAMELLGGNTLAKLCQVLDINSPSHETYAIGVNTVLGLKNGIEDPEAVGELMNSIAEFGLKIKQAYKETADEKYIDRPDILSDDAYEPVIRPLVDMSGVEAGINSFFANRQFSLSGTIGNAMAAQNKGPSVDAIMITTAVKELGSRVDRLNNSVNELRQGQAETRNAIRGIDIRLDTGALVGGIVNQMDSALGSKAVRVKRRKG